MKVYTRVQDRYVVPYFKTLNYRVVRNAVNFSNYGSRDYRRSLGEVGIIDGPS